MSAQYEDRIRPRTNVMEQQMNVQRRHISLAQLLPAIGEGLRPVQPNAADADVIHFISEGPEGALVQALRDYGCTVLTHELNADLSIDSDSHSAAIVIDVPLLSKSLSICRQLRAEGVELPLVTISASVDPFDEVLGLELGADGIVNRQVHPRVLLARLRSISRRALGARTSSPLAVMEFGGLRVDGQNRDVTLHEQRVDMTAGEFDLLWLLVQSAGQVIRRDEVLQRLRGLTEAHASRAVDARLYRLRRRFVGVPDIEARIKTVRPYGYMFVNLAW
ncbi:MAG: response regulator transcription factor [Usitatibacteraceae bacterium]